MEQVILNSQGARVVNNPRPVVSAGCVLIKVHYSMISVGTEIAPLRSASVPTSQELDSSSSLPVRVQQALQVSRLAAYYLAKACRHPQKAARRALKIFSRSVIVPLSPLAAASVEADEKENMGWNVGYSAAGEIIAVGEGITDLSVGDKVACAGAGIANHAAYINVPRRLACRLPQGCELKVAASATIGSIALQGVRRANPSLGERVAVLGLGLLGQLTVQILRANGCYVIGFDLNEERVERAKKLGMEIGTSNAEVFKKYINDFTESLGVDRTLITAATSSSSVINMAMDITRRRGSVVIVGEVGMNIERAAFYQKEIDLLMSTSYGPGRYDRHYEMQGKDYPFAYVRWTLNRNIQAYLELIASQRLNVEALIDQIVPVQEAPAIYKTLVEGKDNLPLGVLLSYPVDSVVSVENYVHLKGHRQPKSGQIQYALVGAGAFGTCMLVPTMEKCKNYFLKAVVSRDALCGGNFARQNEVELFASDIESVVKNPEIELLVIATRHNNHADSVMAGLKAGKNVFVEKPLAITWKELEAVVAFYHSLPQKPVLMVGFNRRFSPAMQQLKNILNQRRSPLQILYRLNGGFIPKDHWIQNEQGAGRNLGEACHMYDCFRFLTGAAVEGIQASSIHPKSTSFLKNDNFSATLTYEDGSIATLIYTALGPKTGLPKERIEVFCDNEAYIVDDYKLLSRASDQQILWSGEVDKGHFEEFSRLGQLLRSEGHELIPFQELVETTAVALTIEDLIYRGDES